MEGRTLLTLTIDVGDQVLLSNRADQWIELSVTSSDPQADPEVTGLNLRAQVGDGTGGQAEPLFQNVDFTGGIWDAFPHTVLGGPVADSYLFASVVFGEIGQQVPAAGRLVRIQVSTVGLSDGEYPLLLQDIPAIGEDTHFILAGPVRYDPALVDGWIIVGPGTLFVTRFTPTPSGFQARFSRELNLDGLNLYDGAGGTLGPADVILTDGSGQTVAGSMVVADNRRAIEFIKTGGVLTPGTCSVTLKSGASAFRDLADGLLDGNKDGTTGDDFTISFAVAASSDCVVSIPDIARGAAQAVNIPTATAGLPIRLSNADGVTSLAVDLAYSPALLQIAAAAMAAGLPGDWSVALDTGTAGVAKIRASGTTALSGTNVEVVRLTAAVPGDAAYGAIQALRLNNVTLNAGAIAAIGDVAVHKAVYLGDADASGIHSSADAFLVVQAALGLASGFAAHAWTDPRIVGDVDASGVLSAADAFLIVQEGLGLSEPFVPDNPRIGVTPVGGGVDPQFQIGVNLPASVGSLVTVPVRLDIDPAATNVGALDFDLYFDASRLTIRVPDGISAGADTAGTWAISARLIDAGHLRVGMISSGGQPLAPGLREIVRLQFHVAASLRDAIPLAERAASGDAVPVSERPGCVALDIEPVDARAGGYTWTEADGSVLIRPAVRTLSDTGRERIWDDLDAKAEILERVLADLACDVASAWC